MTRETNDGWPGMQFPWPGGAAIPKRKHDPISGFVKEAWSHYPAIGFSCLNERGIMTPAADSVRALRPTKPLGPGWIMSLMTWNILKNYSTE